jgi:8-oxo-dGTP diphosphatase
MIDVPNAASVALIRGPTVLLIERGRAPWAGLWSLPGGRLETGEDAEACARRELKEELGLVANDLRPVMLLRTGSAGRYLLQVYATDRFGGEISRSDEVAAWQWATPAAAAALPTTPHLSEVLARAFAVLA